MAVPTAIQPGVSELAHRRSFGRAWSAGWVAVRLLCATRGQADMRGSCGRRTVDSSWGAAV
jgi:hypothetical protein